MTWFDDGGNKPPHEPPTQAEVEAKAREMFGRKWKLFPESLIRQGDRIIADRLDKARAAILRTR